MVGGCRQQADPGPDGLREDVLRATHAAQHPDQVLRPDGREMLLVMRPYQIVATERILQKIEISTNYKQLGTLACRRLRLAHHRLGQDADQLQDSAARLRTCRTSTRFCSWSTARTSTTRRCGSTSGSPQARPTRARTLPTRSSSPAVGSCSARAERDARERKIIITTIQKLSAFIAANKGHEIFVDTS